MPASELTKRILAAGVKELMETVPLSKLSVRDICAHCQISRNTFYYHFQDKYDLVNWIFHTETIPRITDFENYEKWGDGLKALCSYMQANRKFYINALDVQGQNSFREYLMEFYDKILTCRLKELMANLPVTPEDIAFTARFYAHALIGLLMDWAKEGMKTDPLPKIDRIRTLVNGTLFSQLKQEQEKS